MEIAIKHPRFQGKKLSVSTRTIFKNPSLLIDGIEQKKMKGLKKRYLLEDDNGSPAIVEIKSVIDPIPTIVIDGEKIPLAPPMAWYEYVLLCLPFLLIFIGGAIGGFVGLVGAMINASIIRGQGSVIARYGYALLVTIICYLVFFVIASVIASMFSYLK
ncbi:hypothetical protein [Citrobacter sp. Cu233]|uniref:hypothetical protein n=1 Tax=Citrobacter sp. Cu233 TaxID=2985160 RepID=UPI0025775D22|nr:hypothetical protein [Citrobacter sp. Cu233]MDM2934973.1 hypothetical protein [Citrobacter sp. Cu233]